MYAELPVCSIISRAVRLTKNRTDHKMCGPFSSSTSAENILCSDKYLAQGMCKRACKSSSKVVVTIIQPKLKLKWLDNST
jgi:hypothetical protein